MNNFRSFGSFVSLLPPCFQKGRLKAMSYQRKVLDNKYVCREQLKFGITLLLCLGLLFFFSLAKRPADLDMFSSSNGGEKKQLTGIITCHSEVIVYLTTR